jgi:flagellar motor switch protein FliG
MTMLATRSGKAREGLSGVERAAALLLALGDEYGADVWTYLDDDEIRQVTAAMTQLGSLRPNELEKLITEFAERLPMISVLGDYDRTEQLLKKLLPADKAELIMEELRGPAGRNMWQKMSNVQGPMLANYLKNEHPQTIALVLSRIQSRQTASVLTLLPEKLVVDVIDRMIHMEAVPKATLQNVEAALRSEFMSSISRATGRNVYEQMAEVFNQIDRDQEERILGALDKAQPDMAEKIRSMMFVFDDIADLEPQAIQTVIRQVDTAVLAKALKGSSARIRDTFVGNMSKRAGKLLLDELDILGPLRLKQVEEARQQIVTLTRELERKGEITITRADEADDLVM